MADTALKGSTIATSYDWLVFRGDTFSSTGNRINLMNDSGVVQPSSLYIDSTNVRIGLGTATPDHTLEISNGDAGGDTQVSISCYDNDAADMAKLILRTADGTESSPALIDDNDILGVIEFSGYTNAFNAGAQIIARASATPASGSDMPADLEFYTTPDGSATPVKNMVILSSGHVGLGDPSPANHLVVTKSMGSTATLSSFYNPGLGNTEIMYMRIGKDDSTGDSGKISFYHSSNDSGSNYLGLGIQGSDEAIGNNVIMAITKDGNVGIGNPAPTSELHVNTAGNTDLSIETTGTSSNTAQLIVKSATKAWVLGTTQGTGDLFFAESGVGTWMTIQEDGNVGIGTTAPDNRLQVGDYGTDQDTYVNIECSVGDNCGIKFTEHTDNKWIIHHHGGDDELLVYDYSDSSNAARIQAGDTMWETTSDLRIKKDIENIDSVLDGINNLRPITYKRKYGILDKRHPGLIAQEVKPHFPLVVTGNEDDFQELVPTEERPEKFKGAMGMTYPELIPYLIKAIQELSAKVTALENA